MGDNSNSYNASSSGAGGNNRKVGPIRPLLNRAPLTIENLSSRVKGSNLKVLPAKILSPGQCGGNGNNGPNRGCGLPPPPRCCPPRPPCCMPPPPGCCMPPPPGCCMPPPPGCCMPPPPGCCMPPPPGCCMPPPMCPPCPPQLCYPPPCPQMFCCPQPYCCPYPCMPPPNCCPPPPCPPPPCCPKPGDSCNPGKKPTPCCGAGATLVCVPKGQRPANASNGYRTGNSMGQGPKPGFSSMDQPASYNNCNFYVTEMPKGFNSKNGMGKKDADDMWDESVGSNDPYNSDPYNIPNIPAGDGKVVPPPLGYPGSERKPWGNDEVPIASDTSDSSRYEKNRSHPGHTTNIHVQPTKASNPLSQPSSYQSQYSNQSKTNLGSQKDIEQYIETQIAIRLQKFYENRPESENQITRYYASVPGQTADTSAVATAESEYQRQTGKLTPSSNAMVTVTTTTQKPPLREPSPAVPVTMKSETNVNSNSHHLDHIENKNTPTSVKQEITVRVSSSNRMIENDNAAGQTSLLQPYSVKEVTDGRTQKNHISAAINQPTAASLEQGQRLVQQNSTNSNATVNINQSVKGSTYPPNTPPPRTVSVETSVFTVVSSAENTGIQSKSDVQLPPVHSSSAQNYFGPRPNVVHNSKSEPNVFPKNTFIKVSVSTPNLSHPSRVGISTQKSQIDTSKSFNPIMQYNQRGEIESSVQLQRARNNVNPNTNSTFNDKNLTNVQQGRGLENLNYREHVTISSTTNNAPPVPGIMDNSASLNFAPDRRIKQFGESTSILVSSQTELKINQQPNQPTLWTSTKQPFQPQGQQQPFQPQGLQQQQQPFQLQGQQQPNPLYRTTTQTQLQIIERPNQPSEVRVIKKPVQEFIGYQGNNNDDNYGAGRAANFDVNLRGQGGGGPVRNGYNLSNGPGDGRNGIGPADGRNGVGPGDGGKGRNGLGPGDGEKGRNGLGPGGAGNGRNGTGGAGAGFNDEAGKFDFDKNKRPLAKTNCYRGQNCGPLCPVKCPCVECKCPRVIPSSDQKPFITFPPACPVRETLASILHKKPPAHCKWHNDKEPFPDYCKPSFKHPAKQKIKYVDRSGLDQGLSNQQGQNNTASPICRTGRGVKRRLNQKC